ncbi:MAG: NADPH-dependent oxidoreductase, partial [Mucinivorans sp.]
KTALAPCHFNQPMVTMAPAVVTFCADVARFEQWCRQRQATPSYKNMLWFLNAAIDTLLSSENFALEAENQGLGICYLGTTLYNAEQIIEILELPVGVIPITTVVVGYAATEPPLAPRLPLEAVVHFNKYTPYSAQEIDHLWADIENSEQTTDLITQNNLPNLAQIFTKKRYTKADSDHFSTLYIKMLTQQGFL